jgi:hypothetical protein
MARNVSAYYTAYNMKGKSLGEVIFAFHCLLRSLLVLFKYARCVLANSIANEHIKNNINMNPCLSNSMTILAMTVLDTYG